MAKLNGRWLNGRVIRVERANARREFDYPHPSRFFGA